MWRSTRARAGIELTLGGIPAAVDPAAIAGDTPVDVASAAVAVDQPRLVATGADLEVDKLSRIRAKYGPLVTTDTILGPLAAQLGVSEGRLRATLTTAAPANSLLIILPRRPDQAGRARRV